MRKLFLTIHLYIGFTIAVVMTILGLTGTFLVFESTVDHHVNAGMDRVSPVGTAISLDRLRENVEQKSPGYFVTQMILPENSTSSTLFHLDSPLLHRSKDLYVDQWTGNILGVGSQRNRLTRKIRQLHTQLLGGAVGNEAVTWSTVGLAVVGLTGLALWWPRKVFSVRLRSSLPRLNNDLHHSLGFWSSWAMLLFSASGLLIHASRTPDADPFASAPTRIESSPSRASISRLFVAAQQALPVGRLTRIDFSLDPAVPTTVTVRLPEDRTPLGRSSVKLDPRDGRILTAFSAREAPLSYRVFKVWARELHTGDIYGWPTRMIAALCSFALSLLALSGTMIWLNKKIAVHRGRQALGARKKTDEMISVPSSF